jgi:hypothetical protein
MNLNEQTNRIKQMMGLLSEQTIPMTVDACKALLPKNIFEEAKQWWIDWLDNENTQARFAYQNDLKKREVKKYIELYKKRLNELKLIFVIDPKSDWVGKNVTAQYINPDTMLVNCNLISQDESIIKSFKEVLIHEITHALNDVKPLVPYENIKDNFMMPNYGSEVKIMFPDEMKEKLIQDGFEELVVNSLVKTFYNSLEADPNFIVQYSLDGNEILARLEGLRFKLNKKSGEPITVKDMNDLYKKAKYDKSIDLSDLIALLFAIMISRVSLYSILQNLNKYTYVNPQNKNYNV